MTSTGKMNRSFGTFTALLLGLAAAIGASGCKKSTYLEVDFTGASLPPLNHIDVTLTLTNATVDASVSGPLPATDAMPGVRLTLPVSASFSLDNENGDIHISADAIDENNVKVGHAEADTTIMHGQTWKVVVDFDATPIGDAGTGDAGAGDAADGGLVTQIDGGTGDAATGCREFLVVATETVTVNASKSGPDTDAGANVSGNLLSATVGPQRHLIGWMKYGVHFLRGLTVMSATLNLTLASTPTGVAPKLIVDYSQTDGWTRTQPQSITLDGQISAEFDATPLPAPAVNVYPLDVTKHDWSSDINDSNITLGIDNLVQASTVAEGSQVEFYGYDHTMPAAPTRAALDIVACP